LRKTPLLATLAIGIAAALTLAGCSGAASSSSGADASIAVGSLYEPVNLDNTAGGGQGVTEALNGNVYEGLFKLTDDGAVEPLLATKYAASADGQAAHQRRRQVEHRARARGRLAVGP